MADQVAGTDRAGERQRVPGDDLAVGRGLQRRVVGLGLAERVLAPWRP